MSIHFIKSFIIGLVYICLYKVGQSENFLHIVLAFIMFDIFYTFINWSMSLAIISKVNEIKEDYDIIDYTNDIRICIIKVIVILSLDFVLYSIHFYCLYRKYKGDEIKIKLFQENESEHKNTYVPDSNIQFNILTTRNELLSLSHINISDYTRKLEENNILKNENERLKKLFPFEINENEKLMLLIFNTSDNGFSYPIMCKNTETLAVVEQRFFSKSFFFLINLLISFCKSISLFSFTSKYKQSSVFLSMPLLLMHIFIILLLFLLLNNYHCFLIVSEIVIII